MGIEKNGQMFFTFEGMEIDFEKEARTVDYKCQEYRNLVSITKNQALKKQFIKKWNVLSDIRENLFRMAARGLK